AASATQINLSWTASTDNVGVTGYLVYRNAVLVKSLGVVTSYSDTGLAPTTSYSYTVKAFDAAGNVSAASNTATATTLADTTAPPHRPQCADQLDRHSRVRNPGRPLLDRRHR